MTFTSDTEIGQSEEPATLPVHRPWPEIGRAVLILSASILLGLVIKLATTTVISTMRGVRWTPDPTSAFLLGTIPAQVICIWMVVARAKQLTGGDVDSGLANVPIVRPTLFVLFILLELFETVLNLVYLIQKSDHGLYKPLTDAARQGPFLLMVYAFQLTVLAPVSEELLFRGWLWTALRRSWGAWSTGFVTGIGWWLLHAGFGSNAIFRLLPSVVILSLVRENTGSVRASVILHVLSNMRMVIVSLIALSFSL